MKVNSKTAISTSKVLLAPYEPHHVAKYHGWMQDPEIQEATASEPLSLEEEYSNCVSWRQAHDKLTFIVCRPVDQSLDGQDVRFIPINTLDSMDKMIGDVNFFLYQYDGDEEGGSEGWLTGEVDIMIADLESRRSGLGRAAVCALLVYIQAQMELILEEYVTNSDPGDTGTSLKGLMVKIKETNQGSRVLFEKLGFQQQGEINYFGEVKMVMDMADLQKLQWWEAALADYEEVPYG